MSMVGSKVGAAVEGVRGGGEGGNAGTMGDWECGSNLIKDVCETQSMIQNRQLVKKKKKKCKRNIFKKWKETGDGKGGGGGPKK